MMLNRRHLLAGAVSATAFAAAPAAVLARTRPAPAPTSDPAEAAKLNAVMDDIMQRTFRRNPETASSLGLDKGDLAWTKALFTDNSLAALAEVASGRAKLEGGAVIRG